MKSISYEECLRMEHNGELAGVTAWRDDPKLGTYTFFLNGEEMASISNVPKRYPYYADRWNCEWVFNMTFMGHGWLNEPMQAQTVEEAKKEFEDFFVSKCKGYIEGSKATIEYLNGLLKSLETAQQ